MSTVTIHTETLTAIRTDETTIGSHSEKHQCKGNIDGEIHGEISSYLASLYVKVVKKQQMH